MSSEILRPKLKDNSLFAFSDPGGAKPLLALIEQEALERCTVISDRVYPFYKNFKARVEPADERPAEILDRIKPAQLFTATSYRSDLEKNIRVEAMRRGVHCTAYVDHWTEMRSRFELKGEVTFPDEVWVIDVRAREIAIDAGIPASTIVIAGNPYQDWLAKWKPAETREAFARDARLNPFEKWLMFAPDPLTNVGGKERYGFDEITVLRELADLFESDKRPNGWQLLVKLHPNQRMELIKGLIPDSANIRILPYDTDTNTCLYHSDIAMGFFSSALIEARVLGTPVLRYIPVEQENDPIAYLNIGNTVNNCTTLIDALIKNDR
jgi:hypothetical protein